MTMTLPFDNSYARLPERFFARLDPAPVRAPALLALNRDLALRLGLDPEALATPEGVAMLAGNAVPAGAAPLAQAYAGHQFGGWVPTLGDGRAVLLGEIVAPDGARVDLALKGAGQTPFSRRGDGRAWLGPVLREYLVSEAMAALGVPTTRALAAVATGEVVVRDAMGRPGAVLARVAASHIRVGTFQYFAARGDTEALSLLADQVIARHFPEARGPLELLRAVVAAQAQLIAAWMALGFIHGVMNTDNMAVSGETIDYGPCAFMDAYHPSTVFSSIDQYGRYAYANQPQIAAWNLAQLATCLLPLMGDREAAIEAATEAVNGFVPLYQAEWLARFGRKIGLAAATPEDQPLIEALLGRMASERADFTRSFRGLVTGTARDEFAEPLAFDTWAPDWQARLAREADPQAVMTAANPVRIPRNHRVEAAIAAAVEGDLAPFTRLSAALADPFAAPPEFADLEAAPRAHEIVHRTFCGT
ncbi:protein adenylyltransferase SelO [Sinirhodobacter huangdaonensis]|uniref:Protein nucleotidyltransferase YdiU n=1 Tax=Paenirhodobacter huangdaonensis TaxID=2501515 RepID=A0A3S3PEF8_9RHOB|nr:YdiU family protein [Sinirhodobacter huangdaonensis]RWR50065.1 YdiU family protein [Sinirhodobacter huangdaonensis]